jgi:hypothetical protein
MEVLIMTNPASTTEATRNAIVEMLHRKQMVPAARAVREMVLPTTAEAIIQHGTALSDLTPERAASLPTMQLLAMHDVAEEIGFRRAVTILAAEVEKRETGR